MEKTTKEVLPQAKYEIELKVQGNVIWQRLSPAVGSGVFTPLLEFESSPISSKYTRKQFAELICRAVNERQKLIDLLEKSLAGIEFLAEEANYQSARWISEHVTPIKTAINNAKNNIV